MDPENYDPEGDLMILNLGPQHPSTHGVFRVKLWLDGEVCIKAVPYPGYLHRGVEKLCEKLSYVMITPIVDKNDYVSPFINELAINMAFEALNAVETPRRANYLRTLGAEMQRVGSHLLWLGTFGLDMGGALGGGASVFMHCFRERELILDCFELWTGSRFHYNTLTVGGNRHDVPAGFAELVRQTYTLIGQRADEYDAMLVDNAIFRARTKGVGTVDAKLAMELGVSGPILRASGIDWDLRRDRPYAAYNEVKLDVPVRYEGDCFARYEVRMAELRESIRIVLDLIDGIPEGPICALKPVKLPGAYKGKVGQAYAAVEGPRGELGTWVIADGTDKPYRCKIRPPSYHAVSLIPYLAPGNNVSDIVVTLGSLDPILGEVDR
ncbi:NADH-quinone oxidoreductase subunit D [Deltaproteobacteria bacterium]|nr:NADH-quinone oxidoreductase subunit D [Deltaproteobacteria bacterium]